MKKQQGNTVLAGLLVLAVIILGGIGWVMNLYKLVNMSFDVASTGEIIARVAGIFPVIGAVVGWF